MSNEPTPRCPVCGQRDEVEALPAIYKAAVPKLSFTLRPPTAPGPPVLRTPVEVPPHPDDPQAPYQNRAAGVFALRGLLPLLLSMTACMVVFRLASETRIAYGDVLYITILLFIAAPLSVIALTLSGRFVYRWVRHNVLDATYAQRRRAHLQALEENERRAAENERIEAAHAEVVAEHERLAHYWQTLYTCHRDEIVFDPATGDHHPRASFREALLAAER
jgi:hypothetical protein